MNKFLRIMAAFALALSLGFTALLHETTALAAASEVSEEADSNESGSDRTRFI